MRVALLFERGESFLKVGAGKRRCLQPRYFGSRLGCDLSFIGDEVQGALVARRREWRELSEIASELPGRRQRVDSSPLDEADSFSRVDIEDAARQEDVAGHRLTHDGSQTGDVRDREQDAEPSRRDTESGVLSDDPKVTRDRELHPGAQCCAVDGRDDGNGLGDDRVQQPIERWPKTVDATVLGPVRVSPSASEIGAGTEGLVAGAADHDHTQAFIANKTSKQLFAQFGIESIPAILSIDDGYTDRPVPLPSDRHVTTRRSAR